MLDEFREFLSEYRIAPIIACLIIVIVGLVVGSDIIAKNKASKPVVIVAGINFEVDTPGEYRYSENFTNSFNKTVSVYYFLLSDPPDLGSLKCSIRNGTKLRNRQVVEIAYIVSAPEIGEYYVRLGVQK